MVDLDAWASSMEQREVELDRLECSAHAGDRDPDELDGLAAARDRLADRDGLATAYEDLALSRDLDALHRDGRAVDRGGPGGR